jgi:hypothetical protein
MKDVILWMAVFGPGILIVATVFVLGLCKAAARGDEQMERAMADYNSRHGKTLPCATSTQREWARVLRPSSAPDQSGDSRRRGDC